MKCLTAILKIIISVTLLTGCSNGVADDEAHAGPVMNYHRIDDRLLTGGHLLDNGPATLAKEGVRVVIDLRDEPPAGEKQRYASNGINWSNVPVVWSDPKPGDFEQFRKVMVANDGEHVMVQCAANYRASAMTYLYRVIDEGVPEAEARNEMSAVWDPDEYETWRKYIDDMLAEHLE